jgi:hypothetical protein
MADSCGITPEARCCAGRCRHSRQGIHAFLDARAARVVQADDRRAVLGIAMSMIFTIFCA